MVPRKDSLVQSGVIITKSVTDIYFEDEPVVEMTFESTLAHSTTVQTALYVPEFF